MTTRREYSEQTASAIDNEVRLLLDQAHERVRQTLTESRDALERVALLLLEREVVDQDELASALREKQVPSPMTRETVPRTSTPAASEVAARG